MPNPTLTGRLLVATPALEDPNFHRTIVLLLAHSPAGALGLVLNRPSHGDVEEFVPAWGQVASTPARMFFGGPVGMSSVIGLGRSATPVPPDDDGPFTPLLGSVGTLDLHRAPEEIGVALDGVRLFAGSAGWGAGQLEDEIEFGSWFVVDAEEGDVFTDEPGDLWRTVLRRQPGPMAWYANAEGDPRFN
ncbi:MAG TPA: YqgE/AlgH family protein [Acidimicrobiales bacterium]|jgi:putative transcriptional regulator|nr:YqgE/AlgH family protein [Acidimicrobiales bacterium]